MNHIKVSKKIMDKWQNIIDMIVDFLKVKECMIVKAEDESIEIIASSNKDYHPKIEKRQCEFYCEQVFIEKKMVYIKNANEDEVWRSRIDDNRGIISYLGIPLKWGNGEIFGSLCLLGEEEIILGPVESKWIDAFRLMVEESLRILESMNEIQVQKNDLKNMNVELSEQRKGYENLVENFPDTILIFDIEKKLIFMNRFVLEEDFDIGKINKKYFGCIEMDAKHIVKKIRDVLDSVMHTKQQTEFEYKKENLMESYLIRCIPQYNPVNQIEGCLVIIRENSELLRESLKRRDTEKKLEYVLKSTGEFIWDWDIEKNITEYTDSVRQALGYDHDLVCRWGLGKIKKIIHPEDFSRYKNYTKEFLRGDIKEYNIDFRMRCENGEYKWFLNRGSAVKMDSNKKPKRIMGLSVDITKQKEREKKIQYFADRDILTGSYNRSYFEKKLKELDKTLYMPLGIILCDVDGLKVINDGFGHQSGDQIIEKMSIVLEESIMGEMILSRMGGDEFAILMPRVNEEVMEKIVNEIELKLKETIVCGVRLSASIGYGIKNIKSEKIDEVYKLAEDEMYKSKLLKSRSTRSTILTSLQKSLQEKTHETEAHCRRLEDLAIQIGMALKLGKSEIENIKLLAMLHDIGKIAIPDRILNKNDALDSKEWEEMKKHSEIGYRIALTTKGVVSIAEGILSHHECWDGNGYPQGLKGDEIPLVSRIVSVVDAYDAMITDRPYKAGISEKEAFYEIKRNSGSQFDPAIVDIFLNLLYCKMKLN